MDNEYLIKSPKVAPMNMAHFGGKGIKKGKTLVPNEGDA